MLPVTIHNYASEYNYFLSWDNAEFPWNKTTRTKSRVELMENGHGRIFLKRAFLKSW